jgi:hypothetical protein
MHRFSFISLLILALALLALNTGTASADQRPINASPGQVWAACNANGGYGGSDPKGGVVCVKPGCDGNAKHACIIDCPAGGKCTATTPHVLSGQLTLSNLLNDQGQVAVHGTDVLNLPGLGDTGTPGTSNHGYGVPPIATIQHQPESAPTGTFGPSL